MLRVRQASLPSATRAMPSGAALVRDKIGNKERYQFCGELARKSDRPCASAEIFLFGSPMHRQCWRAGSRAQSTREEEVRELLAWDIKSCTQKWPMSAFEGGVTGHRNATFNRSDLLAHSASHFATCRFSSPAERECRRPLRDRWAETTSRSAPRLASAGLFQRLLYLNAMLPAGR